MSIKSRYLNSDFHRVFNFHTEETKGRTLVFLNVASSSIGNAVISGALYTAFLAENGIDIVRVGIISFIPYISWLLSVFSPMVLQKIKKRQRALLINDWVYYVCIVLATTVMPLLVEDAGAKTFWFAAFLLIGNIYNAVIGNGYTAWTLRFIPREGYDLNVYTAYNNLLSLIVGNVTGIAASFAADAIASSGYQFEFLFWMRIGAFLLFVVGSSILYLMPKDEPLPMPEKPVNPLHVVTEPMKYKPFRLVSLIAIIWGILNGINGNTYTYYAMETVGVPMPLMYVSSITSMIAGLFFSGVFRKLADRFSAYRLITAMLLFYLAMEVVTVFIGPGGAGMYAFVMGVLGFVCVGFNMGYNTLFYLNLPESGNYDLFSTFWNLIANISVLVGAALGTWILAILEAHGIFDIFGMDFYPSQLLCTVKVVLFILMIGFMLWVTPKLQKKEA